MGWPGLDANTVRAHTKILEDLFLVRQLRPWHVNLGSRQIKSPKVYIVDNGFLGYLIGANERRIAQDGAVAGPSRIQRSRAPRPGLRLWPRPRAPPTGVLSLPWPVERY